MQQLTVSGKKQLTAFGIAGQRDATRFRFGFRPTEAPTWPDLEGPEANFDSPDCPRSNTGTSYRTPLSTKSFGCLTFSPPTTTSRSIVPVRRAGFPIFALRRRRFCRFSRTWRQRDPASLPSRTWKRFANKGWRNLGSPSRCQN